LHGILRDTYDDKFAGKTARYYTLMSDRTLRGPMGEYGGKLSNSDFESATVGVECVIDNNGKGKRTFFGLTVYGGDDTKIKQDNYGAYEGNTPIAPPGTTGIYTFVIENSIAAAEQAKYGILENYLLDTDSEFLESLVNMTSRTADSIQTEIRDRYIQLSRNSYIRNIRIIGISNGTIRVVKMNELNIKTVKNPTSIDDIDDIRTLEKSGAIVYSNYYTILPESHVDKILKIVDMGSEYNKMQDYDQLDPQPELIDNMDYMYVDGQKHGVGKKWQKNSNPPKTYDVNTNTQASSVNTNTNRVNQGHSGLNKP